MRSSASLKVHAVQRDYEQSSYRSCRTGLHGRSVTRYLVTSSSWISRTRIPSTTIRITTITQKTPHHFPFAHQRLVKARIRRSNTVVQLEARSLPRCHLLMPHYSPTLAGVAPDLLPSGKREGQTASCSSTPTSLLNTSQLCYTPILAYRIDWWLLGRTSDRQSLQIALSKLRPARLIRLEMCAGKCMIRTDCLHADWVDTLPSAQLYCCGRPASTTHSRRDRLSFATLKTLNLVNTTTRDKLNVSRASIFVRQLEVVHKFGNTAKLYKHLHFTL